MHDTKMAQAKLNSTEKKIGLGTTVKLLVPKFIELLWEYPCLARVSSGRLFRARAATTGKARSPRVARRVDKDSQRLSNQPELCQVKEAGSGEFGDWLLMLS